MKDTIRRVKSAASLVSICEGYGITLTEVGDNYQGLCPFHNDSVPSLIVYSKENRFKCFGQGCGKYGDVIDFVREKEGLSFQDTLQKLAVKFGIPFPSAQENVNLQIQFQKGDILDDVARFYSNALKTQLQSNNPLIGAFFRDRGINTSSIDRFRIGYAPARDERSMQIFEPGRFDVCKLLESGLVRTDAHGYLHLFFSFRIIFPFLKNGKAFYLTGRAIGGDNPRYLNLPTSGLVKKDIYNLDALDSRAGDIFITEGVIDCIIAEQNGFSTIALAGTAAGDGFAKRLGSKNVYIVFDNDENGAGQKGAEELALRLLREGKETRIVRLPREQGKAKVDLADFLTARGRGSFISLVEQSASLLDLRIEEARNVPEDKRNAFIREKIFPLICRAGVPEMEFVRYLMRIKEELKLKTDATNALKKEAIEERKKQSEEDTRVLEDIKHTEMSQEERKLALQYLQDPNLFQNLVNDIRTIGIVGEDTNAQALYLFSLTRKTEEPISAVVFGDSSAGKSYLVKKICSLIPEEDQLILSSASARSFEHAKEEQLKHKFIVVQEIEGLQEVESTIRVMQSEGKLARLIAVKNEETGKIETVSKEIECPSSIITTTTRDRVHPENSTRIFELYINPAPEQTAQIHALDREKVTLGWAAKEKDIKRIETIHKNAQRIIKKLQVFIAFSHHIDFPRESVRNRRDFPRFLSLIQAVALFRQFQKTPGTREGEEYIQADLEDYRVAYELGKKLFAATFSPISERAKNVLEVCLKLDKEEFTRADIRRKAKELGIHVSENSRSLADQLRSLEDADAIECVQGGIKGKTYTYKRKISSLEELDQVQVNVIPSAEKIAEKIRQESEKNGGGQ